MWKMIFFPDQGKVREFYGWPGKLRKDSGKLGKKSGNRKINDYGRLSSGKLFILFKRGGDVLSHELV